MKIIFSIVLMLVLIVVSSGCNMTENDNPVNVNKDALLEKGNQSEAINENVAMESVLQVILECSNDLETTNKVTGVEKSKDNVYFINVSQKCKHDEVTFQHFFKFKVDSKKVSLIQTDS